MNTREVGKHFTFNFQNFVNFNRGLTERAWMSLEKLIVI